jgi:GntR family transcriptional regulator, rspAB operon transcriptional repressor
MTWGRSTLRPRRPSAIAASQVGSVLARTKADPLLQAVEHLPLDEKIYLRLRALILERRILPGERIQVDRLAENLGVSRTPVLNALKRLALEQVVEWRARHGIYVKDPTVRELACLFEIREVLEGLVARRAATQITSDEADQFASMFKKLDFAEGRSAFQCYLELDQRFHLRLVELADSQPLAQAMNAVNLMIFTFQIGLARPPAETIPEHLAIVTALRKRDPDASEKAMRLHLRRSRERLAKKAEAEETRGPVVVERTRPGGEEPGERIR